MKAAVTQFVGHKGKDLNLSSRGYDKAHRLGT